jgi:hypothetical protein
MLLRSLALLLMMLHFAPLRIHHVAIIKKPPTKRKRRRNEK